MYFVKWNLILDIDIPLRVYRMNDALIKGFVPKERSCQNSEVRIQYLCRTPNIWLKLTCWSWWKLSFDRIDTFLPNALFFHSLLIDSDKPSLKYSLLMFSPLNYMHFFFRSTFNIFDNRHEDKWKDMNDEINIFPHMPRRGFRIKINQQLMKQQINLYDPHNSGNKKTLRFFIELNHIYKASIMSPRSLTNLNSNSYKINLILC